MAKNNKVFEPVDDGFDELDEVVEYDETPPQWDGIVELPRVRVKVNRRFNQYKRDDDLIVELTRFNQALLDNGTFTEVD